MIRDMAFWAICHLIKQEEYEFVTASHKGHEARFVFRDISGCPFAVDFFQVVTWDKWGVVKCETVTSLSGLTKYEQSKLPESFWELYNAGKQQERREAVA